MKVKELFEAEANKNIAPWQDPSNPAYVKVNIKDYFSGSSTLNKNGTYSTSAPEHFHILRLKLKNGQAVLPVKFSTMSHFDTISGVGMETTKGLTTLQGCPDKVKKEMWIDSPVLTTLDYLYTEVGEKLTIACTNLKTFGDAKAKTGDLVLYDIGDVPLKEVPHCFEVTHTIYIGLRAAYRKPVLSLFKVKGTWSGVGPRHGGTKNWRDDENGTKFEELKKVCVILDKYSKTRDVIGCQRELIENDLDEYAEF